MMLRVFILIVLLIVALPATAAEPGRIQLAAGLGDQMVLSDRTEPVKGEPDKPALTFHLWKRKDERLNVSGSSVTLGGRSGRLKLLAEPAPTTDPGWWDCRVEEWKQPKVPEPGPLDLDIKIVFRDRKTPPLEARWTNVLVGRVWLLGDRPDWGVAAEPLTTAAATASVASLRIKVVGTDPETPWAIAEPSWIDPTRNPLPVSPQAKAIIARLLAGRDLVPTGLVVLPSARLDASQRNRVAIAPLAADASHPWLRLITEEAATGGLRFDRHRDGWLEAAGIEQRHGRVLPPLTAIRPEPPLVYLLGNFAAWPVTADATVW
jgi:hypothetical protein